VTNDLSPGSRPRRLGAFGLLALAALGALFLYGAFSGDAGPRAAASGAAAAARSTVDPPGPLRYDTEYPTIPYARGRRTDPVAKLAERLDRRELSLAYDPVRGYLDSLLEALDIDPASQILVFSQTSLQSRLIGPETPRAIYFNDDVYVAWVRGAPLEIAAVDPELGPVFYLLAEERGSAPIFDVQRTRCLSCHDSYSLTGGGVPRFIVGSGYTGITGMLVTHEGWILVSDRTPLKSRWGGWYVTGQQGDQVHLGNIRIKSLYDFDRLEELRIGNLENLDSQFDTKPYLSNKSDIVALLVFQHQADVQNLITRLSYDTRTALADVEAGRTTEDEASTLISERVDELLHMMLFVDAAPYTAPISGIPEFVRQFEDRAVRDSKGRSLRDFDLTHRLFRYPLSYLVYSAAFRALPSEAKSSFYMRLAGVLRGADDEEFSELSSEDRTAIFEILRDTDAEFASVAAR
jgi:hypothetical protein